MITAKILNSARAFGTTIHSLQLHYPRIILAELNTHRMLAKSTSSSRAIPVDTIIARIEAETARPLWTLNQVGMQGECASEATKQDADVVWDTALVNAVKSARDLIALGIHKQDANRLLEPFVHVDTIITGTDWDNFFNLRCHPAAAPLMQELAYAIKTAQADAVVAEVKAELHNEWHLPYVTPEERQDWSDSLPWVSAARCARVSYLNHDGSQPDRKKDLALAHKLFISGHMTPFEHVATADKFELTGFQFDARAVKEAKSCIRGGWFSLRYLIETNKIKFPSGDNE